MEPNVPPFISFYFLLLLVLSLHLAAVCRFGRNHFPWTENRTLISILSNGMFAWNIRTSISYQLIKLNFCVPQKPSSDRFRQLLRVFFALRIPISKDDIFGFIWLWIKWVDDSFPQSQNLRNSQENCSLKLFVVAIVIGCGSHFAIDIVGSYSFYIVFHIEHS